MNNQQHTQEPWSVSDFGDGLHGGGIPICQFYDRFEDDFPNGEANARRIVACVNACAGIDTDKLEGRTIAEYVANESYLQSMLPNGDGMHVEMTGLACQMLAASFAGQFVGSGAMNFLEVNMAHSEIGDFTVTIQRKKGKTPGELKADAEKHRDDLLAALKNITSKYVSLFESGDFGFWDVEKDPEVIDARKAIASVKGGAA